MEKRRANWYVFGGLVFAIVYLANHLVSGEHGLIAWRDTQRVVQTKQVTLEKLQRDEKRLSASIRGLRAPLKSAEFDPDLLEERAKVILGVTHPDEFIVYVDRFLNPEK